MIIRMASTTANAEIEWQVVDTTAFQYDNLGVHEQEFLSYHEACAWVMDQVDFVRVSMGFEFIK